MTLSCYGKLPLYKDYLRFHTEGAEAEWFRSWLHAGEVRARAPAPAGSRGAGPAEAPARGVPHGASYRMVMTAPGSRSILVGIVRSSSDEGGLRRFPFALWTAAPARSAGVWCVLPAQARSTWDALEAIDREISSAGSAEDVYARLGGRDVTFDGSGREAGTALRRSLAQWTVPDLWRATWGDPSDPRGRALLAALAEALAPFRRGGPIRIALRFPLPADDVEACVAAGFWIGLLASCLSTEITPSLFLSRDAGREGVLHVFFRPVEEMDYEALMDQSGRSDYIEDLAQAPFPPDDLPPDMRRLADGTGALAAFILPRWR